jgi:hypothetical protein
MRSRPPAADLPEDRKQGACHVRRDRFANPGKAELPQHSNAGRSSKGRRKPKK